MKTEILTCKTIKNSLNFYDYCVKQMPEFKSRFDNALIAEIKRKTKNGRNR